MSGRQFLEWMDYSEVEPFGEERADLRLASILRMLFAVNRDTKTSPEVPGLGEFYGSFLAEVETRFSSKNKPTGIAKRQTWQQQKAILLEHALYAAAAHDAQQRLQARAQRVDA